MASILNNILLIDDNPADNFYHSFIIEESGLSKNITSFEFGQEALDYLSTEQHDVPPQPDLIFLDINMPTMIGWEFLEKYELLENSSKAKIGLFMLTTSLNPDDKDKAMSFPSVKNFLSKPLIIESLYKIIKY